MGQNLSADSWLTSQQTLAEAAPIHQSKPIHAHTSFADTDGVSPQGLNKIDGWGLLFVVVLIAEGRGHNVPIIGTEHIARTRIPYTKTLYENPTKRSATAVCIGSNFNFASPTHPQGNENARSLRQMSPPSPSSLRRHGRRGESKSRPLGGGPGGVGGGDGTNTHGDCEKSLRRRGGGDLPTTTTVYSHVYSRGDVVEGVYVGHRNGAPPAAAVAAAESGATGPSSPAGLTGAVEDDAETRQTSAATVEYGAATLTTATAAAKGEGDVAKRRQQHRYSSGGNRSLTTGYGSNANESGNPCWGSGGGGGSSNNGGGNGVLGGVAAARERAFLAGSSAKLTAMGQRGGGGGIGGWGGRVGGQGSPTLPARDNQQQQQQDQFRQDPQSMQEEYGLEGEGRIELLFLFLSCE